MKKLAIHFCLALSFLAAACAPAATSEGVVPTSASVAEPTQASAAVPEAGAYALT